MINNKIIERMKVIIMKKKFMFAIFSLLLLPSVIYASEIDSCFTTGIGNKLTCEEYSKMQSLGFTDAMIRSMPDHVINSYLLEDIELVSVDRQISQSDVLFFDTNSGFLTPRDQASHTYGGRTMTTYVFYLSSSDTFKIANYAIWDGEPSKKYYDINAAVFNTTGVAVVKNSQVAYQSYDEYKVTILGPSDVEFKTINYSTNSTRYRFHANGIAIAMNLTDPSGIGYDTANHVSYLEYQVKKSVNNQINELYVAGNYLHAKSSVSLEDFIGFDITSALDITLLLRNIATTTYDDGNHVGLVLGDLDW